MLSNTDILLEGVRVAAEFLLEAEAEFLCGAKKHARSPVRVNYRQGHHKRMLRFHIGTVTVRVPNLQQMYARPSMCRRFSRLQVEFVSALHNVLDVRAPERAISILVRMMWTMSLDDALHARLTRGLCAALNQWRDNCACPELPVMARTTQAAIFMRPCEMHVG